MKLIPIIFISTIVLWILFVNLMELKKRYITKDSNKIIQYIVYAFGIFFVIYDVIYNYTVGAIIFWEFADNDRKTLTLRLKHLIKTDSSWRTHLAFWMCKYLIEPWDTGHRNLKHL